MKLLIVGLFILMSSNIFSQITDPKPPNAVSVDFGIGPYDGGKGDGVDPTEQVRISFNLFLDTVKSNALIPPALEQDIRYADLPSLTLLLFIEYTLNPPKTCCGSTAVTLSPLLNKLLSPEAMKYLKHAMTNETVFKNNIQQHYGIEYSRLNAVYSFYNQLANLEINR